jgi:CBS domain-containing protein
MASGDLVGIFTGRDFLNRVAAEKRKPAETLLGEVMTKAPETLGPDDCVSYAIDRMANGGFRNVPIVADGRPVAVISVRDVMTHLAEVFAEIEEGDADDEMKDWVDIGGG